MKRVITVLLAALLVLSLAACGSGVETKKLAGTWTCTIDVTDRMNAAAEQALGLSAADGAAKMPLQLVLTVTEDGAYTLRYDSDAVRTALDAYAAALHPAAVESVYAAAEEQGLSREEYDAAMEKAGITMDDMVAAIFAGVDEEELLSLLSSKWYCPYYLEGSSRNVTLDYTVQITISQPEAVFRYSLTGDKAIDLAAGAEGNRGRSFQVTDSQAFQQSVLDFLLEQEYTEQDARQE